MSSAKKTQAAAKTASKRLRLPKPIIFLGALILLGLGGGFTAMQFENQDSFCASCHSEPETTYFQREAAAPVDLASFHTTKDVRCIDCHSGQGLVPGRIQSLTLGATDLASWIGGHAPQPAPLKQPIDDSHCLKCHADVTQRNDFNNHFHVFLPRWQALDKNAASCVSCHQGHNTDVEQPLGFLNRVTTTNVCQTCHNTFGGGG
jgi:predicted CXXCH cytochrome family protein